MYIQVDKTNNIQPSKMLESTPHLEELYAQVDKTKAAGVYSPSELFQNGHSSKHKPLETESFQAQNKNNIPI